MHRFLLLLTVALLGSAAIAESNLEVRVNRIEMAGTAPDESDVDASDAKVDTTSRATDHNSSRSNKTSSSAAPSPAPAPTSHNASRSNRSNGIDPDSDNDSVGDEVCSNGVDNDCDDVQDADSADSAAASRK